MRLLPFRFRPLRALALVALVAATGTAAPDSPVADAAERGDLEAVRALVRDGADVNAAQGDGMTALHWAALEGAAEMADLLLWAGALPEPATRLGAYTPLHLAARSGHGRVVVRLLEAGADPARATETGTLPLHFAAQSGDVASVRALLERGVEVDARDAYASRTPLMFAVAASRHDVVAVLLEAGADPMARTRVVDYVELSEQDTEERRTRARMLAAARGQDPDAAANARFGPYGVGRAGQPGEPADTAGAHADGEPADTAAKAPERAAAAGPAEQRRERRAASQQAPDPDRPTRPDPDRPSAPDPDGPSTPPDPDAPRPLSYSDLVGRQGGLTPLHFAARDGHLEEALALLDAGADIDVPTGGDRTTPMLMAIINGNYDLAMALLERGADPTLASEDGATPLFAVVNSRWAHRTWYPQPNAWRQQRTGHLDLMEALLESGADPNARLDTHLWYAVYNAGRIGVDFAGATPFWRAAYSLDVDAMRLLAAHGADPNIPTIKPASRRRGGDPDDDDEEEADPSGLPPVPAGGPAVHPLHAASGVGYGTSRVGQQHHHVPDGWMAAVRYLVDELGVDVNVRDHDGYSAMHNAAARGDNEMIEFLAERGGDATLISRRGQTTADMANGPQQRVQPFPSTIALLMSLGSENNDNCQSC